MKKRLLSHLIHAAIAGCGLAAMPVFAANETAAAAADAADASSAAETVADTPKKDTQELGAVTVTAQKRVQDVQKVPISVAVVNQAEIEANGLRDFADLNRAVSSLTIKPAEHPVNASLTIRGIGTYAFAIGVEPSVAVIVDDSPIQFQARAFMDLSDAVQIEVLSGPQSTLYGKSASAGLINIRTAQPTDTLTGKVSGLITNDGESSTNLSVSGPITDHLGFRSALYVDDFDGNITNLYDHTDVNGRRSLASRNKLFWTPNEALNVTLGFDYIDGHTTVGRPFIALSPNAKLRGIYPVSTFLPGVTANPDNTSIYNDYQAGTDYKDKAGSLKVSYDLSGGPTLMSITSVDYFQMRDRLDNDETAVAALADPQTGKFGEHQASEELRLISPGGDRFRYTAGLFWTDVSYSRDFGRGPYFAQASWYATSESTQYAAFGQLEYDVLPGTTLILGLRESHEKVQYTFRDFYNGGAFGIRSWAGSDGDTFGNYKLGVQHQVNDNLMLFATTATGHKGEAYDLTTGFNKNRALAGPVKPETSRDFELGARTQFLDRHLTFNATLFDTKYKDLQTQGIEILPDGTTNYRLTNVGKVTSKGLEIESAWHVNTDLSFGGTLTYLDSKFTDFPKSQCWSGQTAAQGCLGTAPTTYQVLTGRTPALSPKWKYTLFAEDATPVASNLLGVFSAAWAYQSTVNYSPNLDPLTVQKGYGVLNLSAGLREASSSKWQVTAFVNNALDKHYYMNMNNNRGNFGNQLALQSLLPRDFSRYFGVRGTWNFN